MTKIQIHSIDALKTFAFIERNKEGTLDVIYTGTQSFVNTFS